MIEVTYQRPGRNRGKDEIISVTLEQKPSHIPRKGDFLDLLVWVNPHCSCNIEGIVSSVIWTVRDAGTTVKVFVEL